MAIVCPWISIEISFRAAAILTTRAYEFTTMTVRGRRALQVTDSTEILNISDFEDSGDDEDFVGCLINTDDRSDAAQSSEDEDSSDSDDDSNLSEVRAGSSGVGRTTAGRRGRGRRRAGARSLGPSQTLDIAPWKRSKFEVTLPGLPSPSYLPSMIDPSIIKLFFCFCVM
ncbi:hypothetical protein PYW07_007733 [Mythimna separata]|uniref:Uncharacterized protein n=1 Tax=Mythimna separata TaxID=271217 RepID=A0AAD8DV63_MYTSE|nr:hypothetical protein PYW07_007733 [Mythimna separata]